MNAVRYELDRLKGENPDRFGQSKPKYPTMNDQSFFSESREDNTLLYQVFPLNGTFFSHERLREEEMATENRSCLVAAFHLDFLSKRLVALMLPFKRLQAFPPDTPDFG